MVPPGLLSQMPVVRPIAASDPIKAADRADNKRSTYE